MVGTHSLLNRKVEFKKLGLLVIDEEQKFGVNQKERLKVGGFHWNSGQVCSPPLPPHTRAHTGVHADTPCHYKPLLRTY